MVMRNYRKEFVELLEAIGLVVGFIALFAGMLVI